ncbi:MAG: protein-L-isoaspartate(D-aspartate) O-methyltransferase [Candidatus Azotimanducaceae bacterium]|jgi:protein-L-isoaspartate(D-aspartate) O-methyltransferase
MERSNPIDIHGVGMTSQRTRGRLVQRLRDRGIENEPLLEVLGSTPRHVFVDEALASRAYEDTALPIGFNQTISRPYIVARMTQVLLADGPLHNVLEIGTGSGYQTAILAQLVSKVFSVERIQGLSERARATLKRIGLRNIQFKYDDGNVGWADRGPFDGIIVTASPRVIPPELLEQLAVGGRLVIPVGGDDAQQLTVVRMTQAGLEMERLEDVKFVPLLGGKLGGKI